jgi:hypothetical protein
LLVWRVRLVLRVLRPLQARHGLPQPRLGSFDAPALPQHYAKVQQRRGHVPQAPVPAAAAAAAAASAAASSQCLFLPLLLFLLLLPLRACPCCPAGFRRRDVQPQCPRGLLQVRLGRSQVAELVGQSAQANKRLVGWTPWWAAGGERHGTARAYPSSQRACVQIHGQMDIHSVVYSLLHLHSLTHTNAQCSAVQCAKNHT